jgi:peptidoglycan hydrolase CwlO-like protein
MNPREATQMKIEAQLESWQAELHKLEAQTKELNAEGRERIDAAISEAKKRRDDAADKLKAMKSAGESEWEEFKEKTERAVDHVGAGFRAAYDEFRH